MKLYFLIFSLLAMGVVYTNYYIAQSEEEKSIRFIISQEEEQEAFAESLKASLLAEETEFDSLTKEESEEVIKPTDELQDSIVDVIHELKKEEQVKKAPEGLMEEEAQVVVVDPIAEEELSLVKALPGTSITTWQTGKSLYFEFNQEVDLESFFHNFAVTPSEDGKFSGEINYGETRNVILVNPVPDLTKETKYTFTIGKGVKTFDKKKELLEDVQLIVEIK